MKTRNWLAITLALAFTLQAESVRGQALETMEQAKGLLPSVPIQIEELPASDRESMPITTDFDLGSGEAKQESEIIELVQNLGTGTGPGKTKEESIPEDSTGEWDPWEPFNEKTFWFNRQIDRFLLKPVATAYNAVLPSPVRTGVANMFDNLDVTRRLVNNILQLKLEGAGRELARFAINSTVGVVGLFDFAGTVLGIQESNRDTGQTLGVYGIGPGPYLVLPLLPPLSVRDFFGFIADEAMYPLSYFVPVGAAIGMSATEQVSDRAANINRYHGIEETVVDFYGSVRNFYFQKRAADLKK